MNGEKGDKIIRVNSVAPGAIDTPMLRGVLEQFGFTEKEYAPQLGLLNLFGQPLGYNSNPFLYRHSDSPKKAFPGGEMLF